MNALSQPRKPRLGKDRAAAIETAVEGTWEGTGVLVGAVLDESRYAYGWRPGRAALARVLADAEPAEGGAMSPDEFTRWRADADKLASARGQPRGTPLVAIGLSRAQARALEAGDTKASKITALACAHYLFGLETPIEPDDPAAFEAWFTPRFVSTERVAAWLQTAPSYLTERLKGFALKEGVKRERLPDAGLIRALDWLDRMGPFCPYGPRRAVELWPGQAQGLTPDADAGDDY